jgi:uncharacterized protein YyaL (SSP411 family)
MSDKTKTKLEHKYQNNLINEKSPYLLQHAHNPVDWYAWGEEAFAKAKQKDKPIFLSIGYSTCHWCHVMEHESFEDSSLAELMNEAFVCIKVDREERPDIDNIYMLVCQMLTGGGGWPLTIIMTPDRKPFFAGTYIPKISAYGRTGMTELIPKVKEAWINRRQDILASAEKITFSLQSSQSSTTGDDLDESALKSAYQIFSQTFDRNYGGFGQSPKFPTPHNLMFLMRYWKRNGDGDALGMVEKTLREMRQGGMYDHVGFGFHRYSTDSRWFLPHFEKMLYDQAMLAYAYIEAYQITGNEEYKTTANEIFTYVKRDMRDTEGGFYSAEDADSEGEEGKFYFFAKSEIEELLTSEETELASRIFNITAAGNYAEEATGHKTGRNILHLTKRYAEHASELGLSEDDLRGKIETIRQKLFEYREKRIHPHKDDKILTDWNGLMIAAMAKGAQVFDDPKLAQAAADAAEFILSKMHQKDGSLLHRYREGEAALSGYVEDYAFMVWGMIELYEATFELKYLKAAIELNDYLLQHFWDDQGGGLFFTADSSEELIHRQKEIYDGAVPSGNSVAALNLMHLARTTARTDLEARARAIGSAFSKTVRQYPAGYSMLMLALDFMTGPSFEIVVSGNLDSPDAKDMLAALRKEFIPNRVIVFRTDSEKSPEIAKFAAYTQPQNSLEGRATAYVCMDYACKLPTTEIGKMLDLIKEGY